MISAKHTDWNGNCLNRNGKWIAKEDCRYILAREVDSGKKMLHAIDGVIFSKYTSGYLAGRGIDVAFTSVCLNNRMDLILPELIAFFLKKDILDGAFKSNERDISYFADYYVRVHNEQGIKYISLAYLFPRKYIPWLDTERCRLRRRVINSLKKAYKELYA